MDDGLASPAKGIWRRAGLDQTRLGCHSFYEEILVQDGHRLEHVIPPRDLQSWQQLPVSAVATFQPVAVYGCSPAEVRKLLKAQPYQRFPVIQNGRPAGILTRKEAENSISEQRPPSLEPLITCLPNQTIGQLQSKLVDSPSLMAVVLDKPGGGILGLVTLHDLLRAEMAIARESAS